MMTVLYYCKKCGRIVQQSSDEVDKICDNCQSKLYLVPNKYTHEDLRILIKNDLKEQFINECIKSSSEFDQYLFEHREEDMFNRRMSNQAKMKHGRAVLEGKDKGNKFGVSCPYCKATNVRKITVTSKAVHTAVFGLWSIGRNAKNYHCDHCGSDF